MGRVVPLEPKNPVSKSCVAHLQQLAAPLLGSSVRYALVGVLNTLVGYAVFFVALRLGFGHLLALALSYAVGVVHSFLWNRYWTFRATGTFRRQVPKFLAVTLGTFALNAAMLHGLVTVGLSPAVAQLLCLGVTTVVGYAGHRLWSFR